MTSGMKTVVYPVRNLDQPSYVGFNVGDQHVGLNPNGHSQGITGPVSYWHIDDIEASLKQLMDAGAQTFQATRDVGGGRLVATLKDGDGNVIGLIQDA